MLAIAMKNTPITQPKRNRYNADQVICHGTEDQCKEVSTWINKRVGALTFVIRNDNEYQVRAERDSRTNARISNEEFERLLDLFFEFSTR